MIIIWKILKRLFFRVQREYLLSHPDAQVSDWSINISTFQNSEAQMRSFRQLRGTWRLQLLQGLIISFTFTFLSGKKRTRARWLRWKAIAWDHYKNKWQRQKWIQISENSAQYSGPLGALLKCSKSWANVTVLSSGGSFPKCAPRGHGSMIHAADQWSSAVNRAWN